MVLVWQETHTTKTNNVAIKLPAETELSPKLHYDDMVVDEPIVVGSFVSSSRGLSRGRGNIVTINTNDVGPADDTMAEFAKEAAMLDKFWRNLIVHFFGASLIPNNTMTAMECAPCGSLMDCTAKRQDPGLLLR